MYIDYNKILAKINDYAIEKIYDIIEKYGALLHNRQLELLNNLIAGNQVIVIHSNDDKVKEHFKDETIPPASGPRSWGDGLIHIYPFVYDSLSTDEIIEKYINEGIITHELFHYIIQLDKLNNDPKYHQYYSYLNEGFVQYFTEQIEGPKNSCNYRRNVDFVTDLLNELNNNTKSILNCTLDEDELNIINKAHHNYCLEEAFMKDLNDYLMSVAAKTSISHEKLVNYYKKMSINDIKKDIYDQLLIINDEELKKEFDSLITNYEYNKEKKANC